MSPEDAVYYVASAAYLITGVVCFGIVWIRDILNRRATVGERR